MTDIDDKIKRFGDLIKKLEDNDALFKKYYSPGFQNLIDEYNKILQNIIKNPNEKSNWKDYAEFLKKVGLKSEAKEKLKIINNMK